MDSKLRTGQPAQQLTPAAMKAIAAANVVIGNAFYLDKLGVLLANKQVIRSSMGKEVDRAKEAARLAADCNVAMITGGDAGVYGMASIVLEVVEHEFPETDVEVLPGVTAVTAAASRLGSPLSGDYVTLSLSDLLTPWETIEKRLHLAFQMGVPVALYNPKRIWGRLSVLRCSTGSPETPVGCGEECVPRRRGGVLRDACIAWRK